MAEDEVTVASEPESEEDIAADTEIDRDKSKVPEEVTGEEAVDSQTAQVVEETRVEPAADTAGAEDEDEADDDVEIISSVGPERKIPEEANELVLTLGGSWGQPQPKKLSTSSRSRGTQPLEDIDDSHQQRQHSVPDTSLSLGSSGGHFATTFSGKSRSIRSISHRSHSNDCTAVSPSNTRSFVHNPSCSLTQNSLEEFSSATQYLEYNETVSHGVSTGDPRNRSVSFSNGAPPQPPRVNAGARVSHSQPDALPTRWNSYNLEKYHALFPDLKEGFRAKQIGSRRTRGKGASLDECGRSSDNRIGLFEIAADSITTVAHKLQELPDIFLDDLKKSLTEMLGSIEKRDEFLRLQRILQKRNDLSAEVLFLAHRTQLELLVSMKTGIQAFLLKDNPLSTSALVEVFLQKRCRNFACQSQLPADECDCQFCSQKEGFCNACMCIACSKFDFVANTCRWVGCDYCLHWCHTDCGIRLSYIKPGATTQGKSGQIEMQFQCVACNHASDLFGFVKEVFTTCAKEWSQDNLSKELDCIQRIFRRSQDLRGKQLCWIAEQMLSKLEACTNTSEVVGSLLRFFIDGNVDVVDKPNKLMPKEATGAAAGKVVVSVDDPSPKRGYSGNEREMSREKSSNPLQVYDREMDSKRKEVAEMQYNRARKRTEIEEMESLMAIKKAEAKMFQLRADEARLEAEGLKKIVVAKNEKIEEEYVSKGLKLHLNDALEKRKRCFLEYQILDQGLQDFNAMKSKLVSDVGDVLRKIDEIKRTRLL